MRPAVTLDYYDDTTEVKKIQNTTYKRKAKNTNNFSKAGFVFFLEKRRRV